jgi:hypothetical protein
MEWALIDGRRGKAEKSGQIGICPGCNGEVRAKCGEIVSWHWAHVNADCDPWSEPETEWHRKWKGYFPPDWQEVTKPPHRADVAGPDAVLEIQRSGISPEEIREREQFYGRMAWLINGHDFWENLEWIRLDGDYHEFRWKHARKTWITAGRTIFIDTPLGLFRVKKIRDGNWKVICGSFVRASKLIQSLDLSGNTRASIDLITYDAITAESRNAIFEKAEELLFLYDELSSVEEALSSSIGFYPRCHRIWQSFATIYDWLLKASPVHIEDSMQYYKDKLLTAQVRLKAEMAKEEKILQKQQIDQVLRDNAVIISRPEPLSSVNKRLPGKIDWTKALVNANIPDVPWNKAND